MTKTKKRDILFYVAVAILLGLVGLSVWYRVNRQSIEPGTQQAIQATQIALIVIFILLLLLSFRQPLRRMNWTLFQERQEWGRKKRRKKAAGR